jgi:hypothetical protein
VAVPLLPPAASGSSGAPPLTKGPSGRHGEHKYLSQAEHVCRKQCQEKVPPPGWRLRVGAALYSGLSSEAK